MASIAWRVSLAETDEWRMGRSKTYRLNLPVDLTGLSA